LAAEPYGIPRRLPARVLVPLVKAEILYSRKGNGGGFGLVKPASKITLLEIIEAVDGPFHDETQAVGGKDTAALDSRLQQICLQVTEPIRRLLARSPWQIW
jgi:DNA-binding IscR family transcriptional regulator